MKYVFLFVLYDISFFRESQSVLLTYWQHCHSMDCENACKDLPGTSLCDTVFKNPFTTFVSELSLRGPSLRLSLVAQPRLGSAESPCFNS